VNRHGDNRMNGQRRQRQLAGAAVKSDEPISCLGW